MEGWAGGCLLDRMCGGPRPHPGFRPLEHPLLGWCVGGRGGGQLRGEVRGRWGGCQFGSSLGSLLAPFEEVVLPGITLVVV